MEEKDWILVCESCGSRDVETQAWVKPNQNDSCNGYLGTEDTGNNWCCECSEHVALITLGEYEIRKGEDE